MSNGIPTGPRAANTRIVSTRPTTALSSGSRTQRFDTVTPTAPRTHPAIANLPQIIPGGKIDPSYSGIPPDLAFRIKKNDEDAEKLRDDLKWKQEKLRKGLKTWDRLERESKAMGLRSELSERQVRMLAGEGVGGAAF